MRGGRRRGEFTRREVSDARDSISAFATVVDVSKHQVRVIPDAWSFSEGAAFIV